MSYRIYLLGPDALIQAAESFEASDDVMAKEIAVALHRSCSDAFAAYELWRGIDRIAPDGLDRSARITVENFIQMQQGFAQAHQDNILDLEERLESSFRVISKSRRLLELSKRLRAARGVVGSDELGTMPVDGNGTDEIQTGKSDC